MRRLIVGVVFLPAVAMGQSVRGLVTERATSAPALGAIVTLERVNVNGQSRREVRSVLVDERGAFDVGATSGGLYTIFVRRIATRPFRSDTMRLAVGEVRQLDVSLDGMKLDGSMGFMLDRVTVTSATPCLTSQDQAARIATLWDNTRTALLSTAIAARDSLVRRRLIRYARSLDPETLAIQREDVRLFDAYAGTEGGFFRSISGDSLSKAGYWQRIGTGTTRFHGPDENALLSTAFLSDHCFTLHESDDDGSSLIGLGFEPAQHRRSDDTPPEIRGTIWVDASTSELRTLEFTWLTYPHGVPAMRVGGRVEYARLSWGPWFVRRWWLRMPQGLPSDRGTPAGRFGILEEGGVVQTGADAVAGEAPVAVTGIIRDGASLPLAGAAVSIANTMLRTVSDDSGRFSIDSVPAGLQSIVAEHPRYDALGVRAAEQDLLLDAGSHRALVLDAPSDAQIPTRLCGAPPEAGHGTLRVVVVEAVSRVPVPGMRVTLADRNARVSASGYLAHAETDLRGTALFCGAPAERLLEVTAASADKRATTFELALPESGLKVRVVALVRR